MEATINKNTEMNLEEYALVFKELIEKISINFKNLLKNKLNKEEFVKLIKNSLANEIKNLTEIIAQNLKTDYVFIEEYYDFREIQRLIMNILNDESKLNEKNLDIIINILEKFYEITELKTQLFNDYIKENKINLKDLPEEEKKKFRKAYDDFEVELFYSKGDYFEGQVYDGHSKPFFNLLKNQIEGD